MNDSKISLYIGSLCPLTFARLETHQHPSTIVPKIHINVVGL